MKGARNGVIAKWSIFTATVMSSTFVSKLLWKSCH
jgi:hypothetical protein